MLTLLFLTLKETKLRPEKNRSSFYKVVCLVGKLETGKLRLWNPKEISSHITSVTQSCYRDRAHTVMMPSKRLFLSWKGLFTSSVKQRGDLILL